MIVSDYDGLDNELKNQILEKFDEILKLIKSVI
jgi:hypothetical protein